MPPTFRACSSSYPSSHAGTMGLPTGARAAKAVSDRGPVYLAGQGTHGMEVLNSILHTRPLRVGRVSDNRQYGPDD